MGCQFHKPSSAGAVIRKVPLLNPHSVANLTLREPPQPDDEPDWFQPRILGVSRHRAATMAKVLPLRIISASSSTAGTIFRQREETLQPVGGDRLNCLSLSRPTSAYACLPHEDRATR